MDYVWQGLTNNEVPTDGYYSNPRHDLLDCVDDSRGICTILEIGCGNGATAVAAKERWPSCRYVGVELDPTTARFAASAMDDVKTGRIEDHLPFQDIPFGSLDLILAGDVLEHLYNPWKVLCELQPYISEKGMIVASIPNIRNLSILDNLRSGGWRYEKSGLLDVTHIRFFTRQTAIEMFEQTGFEIDECSSLFDRRFSHLIEQFSDQEKINLDLGSLQIQVTPSDLEELCTLQFVIVARPSKTPTRA